MSYCSVSSEVMKFGQKKSLREQHVYRTLLWRHNGPDGVSNHQHHECLLNRPSRRRSKKSSKLRVTGLCAENSPETGEFPTQMASNAENVSIWWHQHGKQLQWHDGILMHMLQKYSLLATLMQCEQVHIHVSIISNLVRTNKIHVIFYSEKRTDFLKYSPVR